MNNKIYKLISKYNNIVIARHIGPDPDAIASQIALRDSIKLTFPKKNVYAVGLSVSRFKYYGQLDKVDDSALDSPLLIALDVPNISRLDGIDIKNYKDVIKIDHHPFEDKMGKLEIIDTKASSTCELVTELIITTKLKMNEDIAGKLYLGIVSDSDRFLVSTTTAKTLEICSMLVKKYKLDLKSLYNGLYERPINEIKFKSYIALNMTITENGFGYLKITNEMIKEFGVDAGTASNLVNDYNYIKEVYAWALTSYDERQELFKVNLRSRGPIINTIASKYNGGGHPYASGARIKNEEDIDKLFHDLDVACKEYKENLN